MLSGVVALILAGGEGKRLQPLTLERAKPAVPFGAKYRIIDFALSNCLHSGIHEVLLAVQYCSHELNLHVNDHWRFPGTFNAYSVSPQYTGGSDWYRGTADGVYQNLSLISKRGEFETIMILGGDHIYSMDLEQMHRSHKDTGAIFTICCIEVPVGEAAGSFGVMEVNGNNRIIGFEEKPSEPKEIPGRPGFCYASMGIYCADLSRLAVLLEEDARNPHSRHDFGRDIIPSMLDRGVYIHAYNYGSNEIVDQKSPYWCDVGTIGAYWDANMDLVALDPRLDIYNKHWRPRTPADSLPPAKETMRSVIENSIRSGGCIVQGAELKNSVLGRSVRVYEGAYIEGGVIFDGSYIGRGCRIRNAIIDEGIIIPDNMEIGYDAEADRRHRFHVDPESGIVVVPRGWRMS